MKLACFSKSQGESRLWRVNTLICDVLNSLTCGSSAIRLIDACLFRRTLTCRRSDSRLWPQMFFWRSVDVRVKSGDLTLHFYIAVRLVWSIGKMILRGRNELLRQKPVQVTLCPPYTPHGLTKRRFQPSALDRRALTYVKCKAVVRTQL
jgi:hypothetical protein